MSQPLLVLRSRGGSTPAVFRLVGATSTSNQVGNTFGSVEPAGSNVNQHLSNNKVIQFADSLFAWQGGIIVKYNSGTGNWDTKLTLSPVLLASAEFLHTGIHCDLVSNAQTMFGIYYANDGTMRSVTSTDGTTWNTSASLGTSSATTSSWIARQILYRNKLYISESVTGCRAFDTAAGTIATAATGLDAFPCRDFCIYQDRLYCSNHANTAATPFKILELTATATWTVRFITPQVSAAASTYGASSATCLHTANDGYMYFWYPGNPATSVAVRKLQLQGSSLFDIGDITSTVAPSGLTSGLTQTIQIHCVYDLETTPGTFNLFIYTAANNTSGTSWTCWQWNGSGSVLTSVDTGGDTILCLPHGSDGGARIWTSGEFNVQITGVTGTSITGGLQISYKAYGTGTKIISFYFSEYEEAALRLCTLGTPSAGTLSGRTITGISADGSTTYTVVWNWAADGLTSAKNVKLIPRIS
jgi:hypothetical protein